MKLNILFLFLFFAILISGCKENPKKTNLDKTTNNTVKDISELTYIEIYKALFAENNGGFDQHGDLYGQEAVSSLSFSEIANTCGKIVYLSNNSTETITLALKASFNFPGNPTKEMVRAYKIKPAEKISVGNTQLCYNSKEYAIKREIISAGFTKN